MFKIIALRILDGCPKNFRKCLDDKKTYFFDNSYEDVGDTDFICKKHNVEQELRVYDIKGYEDCIIHVEVSAVVGKNGEGKSTLIELMLRILNNFACAMGFRASQDTLCYVKDIKACLYYEVEDIIYTIRCDGHGIRWFQNEIDIFIRQGTPQERMNDMMENHRNRLFYSLVINYALYSYNSNLFAYETSNTGSWLDGLFHKNDSYQTPLVINPMRTGGNINVNKELDLSIQRLMAIFTDAGDDKDRRIVSDGVEAHGFAFSLDKGTKLLDVTLGQYFKDVSDDECHMDDLDGDNALEVAQEMFYNFQEFFSSFNELLDKNDQLLFWLSNFEVDNTPKHSYTDLARYVDIIARAYEEDADIHSFNMTHEMKYFVSGKPLRWMNYAQLYRVLFLLAIWEVLRDINVVRLSQTFDKYLQEPNDPINKATLYIPYKIIEILSTYEPYKRRSYHYDASCEAMKQDWPTNNIVTHSPFILTDMLDNNVIYLSKNGKQKPNKRTFAANIYDLLDDHFFLKDTIGDVALKQIDDIVKLYHQQNRTLRKEVFLEKKLFFRLLIDQIADGYLKDDVTQMYYEMLSEYAPNDIQDEIERTQQRLDELKARVSNIES